MPCGLILMKPPCRKLLLLLTIAIAVLEEFRRRYDQGFTKRTLFAVLALAIFLPVLFAGGLLLQIEIGLLAMLGVHELLHMKGLKTMTIEGAFDSFATFALTVPLENYLTFCLLMGNVVAYSVLITIMLRDDRFQ